MAWNDFFSYKIKESDFKKPTEEFVTNALLAYLKEFDYDVLKIQNVSD